MRAFRGCLPQRHSIRGFASRFLSSAFRGNSVLDGNFDYGILYSVPIEKEEDTLKFLQNEVGARVLRQLKTRIESSMFIEHSPNARNLLEERFSWKNYDPLYAYLPKHVAYVYRTNLMVDAFFDISILLPDVKFKCLPFGSNKFVRLESDKYFDDLLALEKSVCIEEISGPPRVTMMNFNDCRSHASPCVVKLQWNRDHRLFNEYDRDKILKQFNVRVLRDLGRYSVVVPRSLEDFYELFSIKYVGEDFYFLSTLKMTKGRFLLQNATDYWLASKICNHGDIVDEKKFLEFKNDFMNLNTADSISEVLPDTNVNYPRILFKYNRLSELDYFTPVYSDKAHLFNRFFPRSCMLTNNAVIVAKENPNIDEISQFKNTDLFWGYSENPRSWILYAKSEEALHSLIEKHLNDGISFEGNRFIADLISKLGDNHVSGYHKWIAKDSIRVSGNKLTKEKITSFLGSIEISDMLILNDMYDPIYREFSRVRGVRHEVQKNDVAFIKLKNAEDRMKAVFLSRPDEMIVHCFSFKDNPNWREVPSYNAFKIMGIRENATFSDVKAWLGDIEYNALIEMSGFYKIYLPDEYQIDKLLELNCTRFDDGMVIIKQDTLKVDYEVSNNVLSVTGDSISQDNLISTFLMLHSRCIEEYCFPEDLPFTMFVRARNPSMLKFLLYQSGIQGLDGSNIFVDFSSSEAVRHFVFTKMELSELMGNKDGFLSDVTATYVEEYQRDVINSGDDLIL